MKFPLSFEATISREDFVRLLPAATASESIESTPDGFSGEGWWLSFTPMTPLVIGSVRLERHQVKLQFDGWSEARQDAFMRRFTHHYQRGGG